MIYQSTLAIKANAYGKRGPLYSFGLCYLPQYTDRELTFYAKWQVREYGDVTPNQRVTHQNRREACVDASNWIYTHVNFHNVEYVTHKGYPVDLRLIEMLDIMDPSFLCDTAAGLLLAGLDYQNQITAAKDLGIECPKDIYESPVAEATLTAFIWRKLRERKEI